MKKGTPIRAIRVKCLECQGGKPSWVKNCEITACSLFTYRLGKNPKRKGIGGRTSKKIFEKPTQVNDFVK